MTRRLARTHPVPYGKTNLQIQFHGENAPALPDARKGKSGRVLLRRKRDYPAATVADFSTAVLKLTENDIEAAKVIAAKRAKDSYYRAQFFRLQSRRGPQKVICAVAASILTAIYHMLKSGLPHRDLGANYFDRRWPEAKARRLVSQLAKLGFAVQLQSLADAA